MKCETFAATVPPQRSSNECKTCEKSISHLAASRGLANWVTRVSRFGDQRSTRDNSIFIWRQRCQFHVKVLPESWHTELLVNDSNSLVNSSTVCKLVNNDVTRERAWNKIQVEESTWWAICSDHVTLNGHRLVFDWKIKVGPPWAVDRLHCAAHPFNSAAIDCQFSLFSFSCLTRGKDSAYGHPLYLAVAAAAAAASSSLPAAQCGTSRLVGGAPASPVPSRRQARKGGQIRFTHEQSSQLEKTFASQRYLTPGQRTLLANKLALTERQVHTAPSPGHHKFTFDFFLGGGRPIKIESNFIFPPKKKHSFQGEMKLAKFIEWKLFLKK